AQPLRARRLGAAPDLASGGRRGMIYRRRPSPLHAARAGAGCLYCLALGLAALALSNPVALGTVAMATVGAALAAGVGREIARAARFAFPFALLVAAINALVTRDGLTVILRLGDLPLLGHTDITLEATVNGAVLGLRAVVLILVGALYTAAIDPDQVLRLFRRLSFRSALSATLATRMVPVLIRDSRRLADAQRCRSGRPPSRLALMRAVSNGVLDRALDVAAALEVRGYGAHRPGPARRSSPGHRSYGRHDFGFTAAAVGIAALALGGRLGGLAPFSAYPTLSAPGGAPVLIVSAVLLVVALLPFADRRGVS
ncbi:MAG: energy-coupling factor transporter transmembrane component T, partial [Solirubrobacteraceae bacterium]